MKILQINSVCGYGSTGRIATDLADVAAEQGHECRIAYGRGSAPARYENISYRIGTDWDVRFHGIKTRLLDAHGFGSTRAAKKLIEWIEEYDPDVIHLHNIHGYYINIEILFHYLKNANKPVIWTLHDCWSFTGHCSHFDFTGCQKWKTGCWTCHQKKAYPGSLLKDRSTKNYAEKKRLFTSVSNMTIVTPSKWLADLVQQGFLKQFPVLTIYNGIEQEIFKPQKGDFRKKYQLAGKRLLLGVASVWDERKGLRDFIELSQMLPEEYKIVLVGLNEKQLKTLPNTILGIARTNDARELAEIYSAADYFLNLTYEDNFPTTNIEALSCGTPVITYQTGGSVEAVDQYSGCIVERGNLSRVAELATDSALCQALSQNACVRAKLFQKAEKYKEYVNLYLAVCGGMPNKL